MSLLWIEGYETHLNSTQMGRKYATFSGGYTAKAGRVHGTAGGPSSIVCTTPSFGTDNTFVFGFGFFMEFHTATVNSGAQGWYVELGSDEQCHLEMESSSGDGVRFLLKRGATTVATSAYVAFGVWHYIELKVVARTGVNGSYELRVNGTTDISGSGVDLADTGGDGWDVWAIRLTTNLASILRFDDMYVLNSTGATNNDFLGASIIEGLLPTSDGASTQWTNNGSGDNYTSVDDAGTSAPDDSGPGGTNGSDTNGQKDLFGFADLQQITGTVHGVQVGVQLGMASAGTRTVKTKYRDPDTTEADGTSHVVDSATFDEFTEVMDVNPASAAAWDVADIDDGQFGVEVVS